MNAIELLRTGSALLIVFEFKNDGVLRFFVNDRKLNGVTISDSYPLPCVDECIGFPGDAHLNLILNINSNYWQIDVEKSHRKQSGTISVDRIYQFKSLLFEAKNASGTF